MISGVSANSYVSYPVNAKQPQNSTETIKETKQLKGIGSVKEADLTKTEQAKIDEDKPYNEGGKASLKYLKEAQYKLDNDPMYEVLADQGLGKAEVVEYIMWGALDPDIVQKRQSELTLIDVDESEVNAYEKYFTQESTAIGNILSEFRRLDDAGKLDNKTLNDMNEQLNTLLEPYKNSLGLGELKWIRQNQPNPAPDESKSTQESSRAQTEGLDDIQSIKDERMLLVMKYASKDDKRLEKWV